MIKNNIISTLMGVFISITTLIIYYKLVNNYFICVLLFVLNMGILFLSGYAFAGKFLTIHEGRLKNLLSICAITILCMTLVVCMHFNYNGAHMSELDRYDPMDNHLINAWIFLNGTMVPVIALARPVISFEGWGFLMYVFFTLLPLLLVWGGVELKGERLKKLKALSDRGQEDTTVILPISLNEGENTTSL